MSDHAPAIPYAAEVRRKALHLGALVLPAAMLVLGRPLRALVLVPLAAPGRRVGLVAGPVRARPAHAPHPLFEPDAPRGGAAARRRRSSSTVRRGCASPRPLVAAVFPPGVAAASMAMLMVGDGAAAVVGRRWGRTKWPDGRKSVEGHARLCGDSVRGRTGRRRVAGLRARRRGVRGRGRRRARSSRRRRSRSTTTSACRCSPGLAMLAVQAAGQAL